MAEIVNQLRIGVGGLGWIAKQGGGLRTAEAGVVVCRTSLVSVLLWFGLELP